MFRVFVCLCLFVAVLLSGIAAVAQRLSTPAGTVTAPVLSFLVDEDHQLRPVMGIPGAASIESPMSLGLSLVNATIAPEQDFILGTTDAGVPVIVGKAGRNAIRPFTSLPPIDRIALSPSGTAAALFSEAQQTVYVVTNMTCSPMFSGKFDIGQLGTVTAFAINDSGKILAVGTSTDGTGALYLLTANEPARLAASMAHISAIAFYHSSDFAVIGADLQNQIWVAANGQTYPLASQENGIARPIDIAISANNQHIFVANADSGSVVTIGSADWIGSEPRYCDCTLTGLHPTNMDSVFRLTDFSGGPILLLDATGATSRLVFVPIRDQ